MRTTTPANLKPIIITELGNYLTRAGETVEIEDINDHLDNLSVTRFNCRGYRIGKYPSGRVRRTWGIWHQSGIHTGVGEHPDDIVARA